MKTKYEQLFAKQIKTFLRQKFVVGNSYKIDIDASNHFPGFEVDGKLQPTHFLSFGMVVSKVNFIITGEGINFSFKLLPVGTNQIGKISYYLYLSSKEDFVDGTLTGLTKKEKILKELTKISDCYTVL